VGEPELKPDFRGPTLAIMADLSPLPARDFNAQAAAHLLWRAGFGGTWEQAEELAALGLDEAVERIVNYTPSTNLPAPECAALPEESDRAFEERLKSLPDEEARQKERNLRYRAERARIRGLQIWWLSRMLTSAPAAGAVPPLEEKLTLFWHSHFASSFEDKIERTYPLWRQNQTFRELALRPFPEQLNALIRDPAMLVWLDNAYSHRHRPNENFARELMELFSMGVGPYSEEDVKESARALTGYSVDRETWTFRFNEGAHDPDAKTFLGRTGKLNGEDVVSLICEQPATAEFLSRKFLDYFVCTAPEPEMVTPVATLYRESGYDLKALLHVLFRSKLFYSDPARSAVVKSPVVLAIGALKAMRAQLPADDLILGALRVMGQNLFFPPDVNGWPGGADWINSNTLLVRYNFANFLMHGVSPDEFKTFDRRTVDRSVSRREFLAEQRNPNAVHWNPKAQLEAGGGIRKLLSARDIVDYFLREFLQRNPGRELRDALVQLAETDGAGGTRAMSVRDTNFNERARGLVHLIMSSPEYQLC
jgi:uncharacterized protein (DUF1800 family)